MPAEWAEIDRLVHLLASGASCRAPDKFSTVLASRLPQGCEPTMERIVSRWIDGGLPELPYGVRWPAVQYWRKALRLETGDENEYEVCASCYPRHSEDIGNKGRARAGFVAGWIYGGWTHAHDGTPRPILDVVAVPCEACDQWEGQGYAYGAEPRNRADGRWPWFLRVVRLDGLGRWHPRWPHAQLREWAEGVKDLCEWVLAQNDGQLEWWGAVQDETASTRTGAEFLGVAQSMLRVAERHGWDATPEPLYPGASGTNWNPLVEDWVRRDLFPRSLQADAEPRPFVDPRAAHMAQREEDWGETRRDLR